MSNVNTLKVNNWALLTLLVLVFSITAWMVSKSTRTLVSSEDKAVLNYIAAQLLEKEQGEEIVYKAKVFEYAKAYSQVCKKANMTDEKISRFHKALTDSSGPKLAKAVKSAHQYWNFREMEQQVSNPDALCGMFAK